MEQKYFVGKQFNIVRSLKNSYEDKITNTWKAKDMEVSHKCTFGLEAAATQNISYAIHTISPIAMPA